MAEPKKNLCVGLLAHVDAGKTTLSEAMLYATGAKKTLGRVDHGDTLLDTHELERRRGITIFSKTARLHLGDTELTLVDTPGHVDFSPEAERVLPVLDCAVLVLSAADGVQAHTRTIWKLLNRYRVPVFLFVNKMDLPDTDRGKLLAHLQDALSPACLDFGDTQNLAENAAMCDEALLETYLASGTVTDGNLRGLIEKRRIFPVCFGAALKSEGIGEFLSILAKYAPQKPKSAEFGARVYKISRDAQGNRLTWLRVTGGSLRVREALRYTANNQTITEKVTQLRLYAGEKFTPCEQAEAGVLCAVTGLSQTYAGQGLGKDAGAQEPMLEPVMAFRMLLPPDCDPRTVLPKLRQLEEEEPQLHVLWDSRLGQITVQLMGRIQLEILTGLMRERFGLDVRFDAGQILYRESITSAVEGVGHFEPLRHYAEVHLLLEPLPQGSGLAFDSACPTDSLDLNFQRLILTHLLEKVHVGVLTGSPITDMKITLMAGRAHVKHTEGGDFRQATYRAVRQGLMQAKSVLLEPWYDFTLTVPAPVIGRAITDIRAMGGEFDAPQSEGDMAVLTGQVPVASLGDYAAQVAAYTRGIGRLHTALRGYAPCHNAQQVIDAIGYDPEADLDNTPDSVFCSHGAGVIIKWDQVPQYMHLESCLRPSRSEAPRVVTGNLRIDDKELEAIMLREFGPVKRPVYSASQPQTESEEVTIREPMQQYLIVDGYNILFAWPELAETAKSDLDAARRGLLDRLSSFAGFRKWRTVVVFDGYKVPGNTGERANWNNLQVVYTKEGQTGDQYIESLVAQVGKNYNLRVATSDSLVQLSSLRSGVLRMSARELIEEIELTQKEMRKHYKKK